MYGKPKKIDGAYPVTRAEAVYVADTTTLADVMPLYGKAWLALGDSITWGSGGTPYPVLLGDRWGMEVINKAVPGTTLCSTTPITYDGDVDYITFWAGINDFKADAPPELGDMTSERVRGQTLYGSLHYICRSLIEAHPAAKILFMTPMRIVYKDFGESRQANAKGNTLEDYARAIHEVCGYYGIHVLDTLRESNICPYIPAQKSAFMPDGLHPSTAGYLRMLPVIERALLGL